MPCLLRIHPCEDGLGGEVPMDPRSIERSQLACGLRDKLADVDGLRRRRRRLKKMNRIGEDPARLLNHLLQLLHLHPAFLIALRKHNLQVIGNRFDCAQGLTKLMGHVTHHGCSFIRCRCCFRTVLLLQRPGRGGAKCVTHRYGDGLDYIVFGLRPSRFS